MEILHIEDLDDTSVVNVMFLNGEHESNLFSKLPPLANITGTGNININQFFRHYFPKINVQFLSAAPWLI